MKPIWTITRRELKAMFDHPTGYILLVVFILVNDFLFFQQAYPMHAGTLRPMLNLLPWIFLFFAPAVTMRALAEETRSGTLEVVLAQPISEAELLAGKFAGQVLFLWIALALTLPIPLGLAFGADLEVGVIVAQYAGSALLALGLAAVGVWASSLTRNQITAFIVGVAVMFLLVLVGWDPLLTGLTPVLAAVAAQLGVVSHFENIARGVIDLRDAVYFATLAAIFLSLAYLALMTRKLAPKGDAVKRLRLGVTLLAAALVVVNLFGRYIGGRLDLTPGKAYTLSRATKKVAGNLPDLVTIKVFASQELPAEIALIQRDLRDVLSDYRAAGKGKIRVVYGDPSSDSTMRNEARNLGIPSVQFNVVGRSELQVKEGYLGLAVQYAGQSKTIPFVQKTDDLEYQLTSFLRALTVKQHPKVAVATLAEDPQTGNTFRELQEGLRQNYDVQPLTLGPDSALLQDVKVLVAAGSPDSLSTVQRDQFSRFLARGGSALIMAGGMHLAPQSMFAMARPVPWNDLLQPYGVSVRPDMVYDLASNERVAMPAQFGRILIQYPYWVRALSTHQSAINQQSDGIFLPWASSVDTTAAKKGTVTPLYVSSRAAGVTVREAMLDPSQRFPTDSLSPRIMAVQVNPLTADSAAGPRGRIVLVGSDDFASDRNIQNAPENLGAALNAVDWLSQDESLIGIRAKERTPPPLVFPSAFLRDGVKYANVIGVPVLLILGAGVHLWRRRQLAKRPYRAVAPVAEAA